MIIGGLLGRVYAHVLLPLAQGSEQLRKFRITEVVSRASRKRQFFATRLKSRPDWFIDLLLSKGGTSLGVMLAPEAKRCSDPVLKRSGRTGFSICGRSTYLGG